MMGHNICFKGVIWKIIPKLSFLPFLSGALTYMELLTAFKSYVPNRNNHAVYRVLEIKPVFQYQLAEHIV